LCHSEVQCLQKAFRLCTKGNITQVQVGGKALFSLVMNLLAETDLSGTEQETLKAGSHSVFPVT